MATQQYVEDGGDTGREAKWQKHVMAALWTVLLLLLLVCLGLVYGQTHHLFHSLPLDANAPWPAEWP